MEPDNEEKEILDAYESGRLEDPSPEEIAAIKGRPERAGTRPRPYKPKPHEIRKTR